MTYETYFIKKLGNEIWPVYLILQKKTFCQKFAEIQKLSISIIMNKLPKKLNFKFPALCQRQRSGNLLEVLPQEINSRELCIYMSHRNLYRNLHNLTNMETTTGDPVIQRLQFRGAMHVILVLPTLRVH